MLAHRLQQVGCPAEAGKFENLEKTQMNTLFLKMYVKIQDLMNREEGQDLVEYALLITLISLAAVAGLNKVSSAVNLVFSNISTTL
jgi:pilus assembly protein Flp/PilA